MCIGICGIHSRHRIEPYYQHGENSHEAIKHIHKLWDNDGINPAILPYEWWLKDNPDSLYRADQWEYKLDWKNPPAWYTDQKDEYIAAAKNMLIYCLGEWEKTGKYPGNINLHSLTSPGNLTTISAGGNINLYRLTRKQCAGITIKAQKVFYKYL
jgi:hypothetical protein